MTPKQTLLTLLFAVIAVLCGYGQNYLDVLKAEHTQGLGQRTDSTNSKSMFHETSVDATTPVPLNTQTALVTGFLFEQTHFSIADQRPTDLYGITLKLGVNHRLDSHWSALLVLLPKVSGDRQNFHASASQLGGLTLFRYNVRESLNYKFGMYANADVFGPMVVPLLGLYHKRNRLEINLLLPIQADISYALSHRIRTGVRFQGINKSYSVHPNTRDYVHKINNELCSYLSFQLGHWIMMAHAGHSLGRSYRTYKQGDQMTLALSALRFGDHREPLAESFGDGFIFKLGIHYRIPIKPQAS